MTVTAKGAGNAAPVTTSAVDIAARKVRIIEQRPVCPHHMVSLHTWQEPCVPHLLPTERAAHCG
jgi:hypothetical protein